MSRNDVQCMLYTGKEGLPETIRKGLNSKVDQLLKVCLCIKLNECVKILHVLFVYTYHVMLDCVLILLCQL